MKKNISRRPQRIKICLVKIYRNEYYKIVALYFEEKKTVVFFLFLLTVVYSI